MTYLHGKALTAGAPNTEEQARALKVEHLRTLREHYRAHAPLKPTDDVLDQRVAEEMELVKRQIERVEGELKRRGPPGGGALAERLAQAEDAIEDLAEIVGADDKC